jgi:SAM-dependent methyltransferase
VTFSLSQVVPWGRNFDEYREMFALSDADLATRVLGCGDGPASFNAEATDKGYQIVSVDPIYRFPAAEIGARIEQATPIVVEQTRRNSQQFTWKRFASVEDLVAARLSAMSRFLQDYARDGAHERYVAAALPELPFPDKAFDLALCSHFLFLYSEQFDAAFHLRAITELVRVASETRIFPLLELGARPSRHLPSVVEGLRSAGLSVSTVRVPYEFQKGAHEMLRIV